MAFASASASGFSLEAGMASAFAAMREVSVAAGAASGVESPQAESARADRARRVRGSRRMEVSIRFGGA